jgi:hypothetical protein
MERDAPGYQSSQPQKRGQVERAGAQDHAGSHVWLVVEQGRGCGSYLGRVGCQGGQHTEQGLGQAQAFTNALEAGYQDPTGPEGDTRSDQEGRTGLDRRHAGAPDRLAKPGSLRVVPRTPTSLPGTPP